jgi:hypothetical protein
MLASSNDGIYNKENPTMYKVHLVIQAPMRHEVVRTEDWTQEKLDTTLGRYLRRHGPPINMTDGGVDGMTMLEYYHKVPQGIWEIQITFEQVAASNKKKEEKEVPIIRAENKPKEVTPPPPPTTLKNQPEPIQAMIDRNALIEVNENGYPKDYRHYGGYPGYENWE